MIALHVTLKLDNPVLMTGVGNGEENSSRTLPYIPGSALRGALIGRYLAGKTPPGDLLQDEDALKLFFTGQARYLNAYPFVSGQRALPTPASIRRQKEDEERVGTLAANAALKVDLVRTTPLDSEFCLIEEDEQAVVFSPELKLSLHTSGQKRGVVRKGDNTLFQYQALAQGQEFAAIILVDEPGLLEKVKALLPPGSQISLGRSRGAEYGQATISKVEESGAWVEFNGVDLDDVTTITLLSDTLLRDNTGQPTLDLDAVLTDDLGKTIQHTKAFVKTSLTGGFNRKWGLPLPQHPALGMGSTFVYPADQVSASDLQQLAERGLGERVVDGFGRFAINWPDAEKYTLNSPPGSLEKPVQNMSPSSQALAMEIDARLVRSALEKHLRGYLEQKSIHGKINNHQLARLRNTLRLALQAKERTQEQRFGRVTQHLGNLKESASGQFENSRVQPGNQRLRAWIEQRLETDVFEELNFNLSQVKLVSGSEFGGNGLKTEFTLRLIDAVLYKRMKANRKEGVE